MTVQQEVSYGSLREGGNIFCVDLLCCLLT